MGDYMSYAEGLGFTRDSQAYAYFEARAISEPLLQANPRQWKSQRMVQVVGMSGMGNRDNPVE